MQFSWRRTVPKTRIPELTCGSCLFLRTQGKFLKHDSRELTYLSEGRKAEMDSTFELRQSLIPIRISK